MKPETMAANGISIVDSSMKWKINVVSEVPSEVGIDLEVTLTMTFSNGKSNTLEVVNKLPAWSYNSAVTLYSLSESYTPSDGASWPSTNNLIL